MGHITELHSGFTLEHFVNEDSREKMVSKMLDILSLWYLWKISVEIDSSSQFGAQQKALMRK